MGREARKVPKDWQHPKNERGLTPLYVGCWSRPESDPDREEPINPDDYMPDWPDAEMTHFMMYKDTSEGTPISPAFKTPEELARWLRVARGGFAPSAVMDIYEDGTGPMVSGVEALKDEKP